ncbi:MAG TPA: class I SAM-dependent methyltransferase [Candidatus Saccharimonadia bacterium]|nr:class I SAM-dependent methyltransferase [Candidatus Saccharimonadia bacterium]
MASNLSDIDQHVLDIKSVFCIDKILNRKNDTVQVSRYYRLNRLAYWLLHDRSGACHLLMSSKDDSSVADPFAQAELVSKEIKRSRSKRVLELAAGKGINVTYLANLYPSVDFAALDLPKGQFYVNHFKKINNISAAYGDFHDLSKYKDGEFGLVYMIEAFMHAKDPIKVLKEIRRVLNPKGRLVIIQDHINTTAAKLKDNEKLAVQLIHATLVSNVKGHYKDDFKNNLQKTGFKIEEELLLTNRLECGLNKLEQKASFFLKYPKLLKIVSKIVPSEITGNVIACYLLPPVFRNDVHNYSLIVVSK